MPVKVEYVGIFKDLISPALRKMANKGQRAFSWVDRAQNKLRINLARHRIAVARISDKYNQLFNRASGFVSLLGGAVVGREVLFATTAFEKYQAVLTNTFGSAELAAAAFEEIRNFAKKTPFTVDELTNSYVKLVNRGFVPSVTAMRRMSDLASSQGKMYDQLVEAALDAQTGEFERLKEFGIRASKSGNQVAFSFKGITTQVAMTDQAIMDYILSLGDLEGIQGASAAQMETLGGKMSNMRDTAFNLAAMVGQQLRPAIMFTMDALSGLAGWVEQNANMIPAFASALGVILGTLGLLKVATWAWNAALAANPVTWVVVAIGALVGALIYAWNNFEGFRAFLFGFWESVKAVFTGLRDLFVNTFRNIGKLLKGVITFNPAMIKQGLSGLTSGFVTYGKGIGDAYRKGDQAGRDSFNKSRQKKTSPGAFQRLRAMAEGSGVTLSASRGGDGATGTGGRVRKSIDGAIDGTRQARSFHLSINKLIENFNLNTTNIERSQAEMRDLVLEALMRAVRDASVING